MSNELTTTSTTLSVSTDNSQFMFNLVTWIGKIGDKPNGTEWEQYMNLSPQLRHIAMDVIKGYGYPEIPSCQFLELFPSVRNDAPFEERFGVYIAFLRNMLAINIGIMGDDTPNNVVSIPLNMSLSGATAPDNSITGLLYMSYPIKLLFETAGPASGVSKVLSIFCIDFPEFDSVAFPTRICGDAVYVVCDIPILGVVNENTNNGIPIFLNISDFLLV